MHSLVYAKNQQMNILFALQQSVEYNKSVVKKNGHGQPPHRMGTLMHSHVMYAPVSLASRHKDRMIQCAV